MRTARPTERQLQFQDWEFGVFLHFGIRTFYEGHRDWDGREMSPEGFAPDELDCAQWVDTGKPAGAGYMVLTAKHHDGFANWPAARTEYSVAASPWREGKGDVVREFVDACHRGALKTGLYYSPAEWGGEQFEKDARAYDDYFLTQISEILTSYGEIDLLWFDGCGSEGHTYDWPRITGEIRRMQPNILIFNLGDPDYRWVGNEAGLAPSPCWNTVEAVALSVRSDEQDAVKQAGAVWPPAECDCRMRERNWFYSDQDEHTVKGLDELMGIYYYSVGRGCNLLINIGPDRRGLLPERDAARLVEFGDEIRRRFSRPVGVLSDCRTEDARWIFEPDSPALIGHAVIQEDLRDGERVRRFAIKILPHPGRQTIEVYQGRNIGHKAICRFPVVRAQGVWLEVEESDGPAAIRSLEFHHVAGVP